MPREKTLIFFVSFMAMGGKNVDDQCCSTFSGCFVIRKSVYNSEKNPGQLGWIKHLKSSPNVEETSLIFSQMLSIKGTS